MGRTLRRSAVVVAGATSVAVALLIVQRVRGPEVEVANVARREIVQTVVASGRVVPPARAQVGSIVLGRVVSVHADEGDSVVAGALLVELDDAEARAALEVAEAEEAAARARLAGARGPNTRSAEEALRQAEEQLELAEADLRRTEQLAARDIVAAQELDRARSQRALRESAREGAASQLEAARGSQGRAAAAALARARADVTAARARLERHRIVAPFDGLVVTRSVEPGDVVQPGAALFVLTSSGPLELRIDPDEGALALLRSGQPALASAEAFPERRFEAQVGRIGPGVDAMRGTVEVRLVLAQPVPELRVDMTVSVDIEVARRQDARVLPASAVRDLRTGTPWALIVEDGIARRRALRLGAIGEESVEILEGASEGERAIDGELGAVSDGSRVRVRGAE